jgi:hypothetical protein
MRGQSSYRGSGAPRRRPPARSRGRARLLAAAAVIVAVLLVVILGVAGCRGSANTAATTSSTTIAVGSVGSTSSSVVEQSTTTAGTENAETDGLQPGDVRKPGTFYGPINTSFPGLTMFRGNGSRTYYGEGPLPKDPKVLWKFGPMSGISVVGKESKAWTGTGWTGQPAVFERDGKTWVVVGCYDWKIHFFDADTGKELLPPFKGGDIFKGSVTVDPDGYPIVYMGNRDNNWRAIAIDRDQPTELWHLNAYDTKPVIWNNDWDGNVAIRNDYAFISGENSHFFIVKLNRGYDANNKVTVHPQVVLDFPGWTEQLFKDIGDQEVSIENSPALVGDRVYFSNSGGLVTGLDVSATLKKLKPGEKPATGTSAYPVAFRYWTGDDTDATIVVDDQGYLYVDVEYQRGLARAQQVGQIIKLDPKKNKPGQDPRVWGVKVTKKVDGLSGVWATACLYKDMEYVPTHSGALLGIDRATGEVVWQKPFTTHAWGSAVVIDKTLVVGDTSGVLHAYDVGDTRVDPPEIWKLELASKGALESTPAVWKGRIYVGSRDGYFYCFGDK